MGVYKTNVFLKSKETGCISRTENRAGCITVGVLLHYLILVTWMWMGAEAVSSLPEIDHRIQTCH